MATPDDQAVATLLLDIQQVLQQYATLEKVHADVLGRMQVAAINETDAEGNSFASLATRAAASLQTLQQKAGEADAKIRELATKADANVDAFGLIGATRKLAEYQQKLAELGPKIAAAAAAAEESDSGQAAALVRLQAQAAKTYDQIIGGERQIVREREKVQGAVENQIARDLNAELKANDEKVAAAVKAESQRLTAVEKARTQLAVIAGQSLADFEREQAAELRAVQKTQLEKVRLEEQETRAAEKAEQQRVAAVEKAQGQLRRVASEELANFERDQSQELAVAQKTLFARLQAEEKAAQQRTKAEAEANATVEQTLAQMAAQLNKVETQERRTAAAVSTHTTNLNQAATATTSFTGKLSSAWEAAGKLQNILAIVGVSRFAKEVLDATLQMNRIETTFKAVNSSSAEAAHSLELVQDVASKLGAPIAESARGLAQLEAAAKNTNLTGAQIEKIFRSLAETGRVLNLSNQQVELSYYALIQMMSKGTVQSEELKRQLGDQIPGATQIAARALGVTTKQFDHMLKTGQILSEDFLPKFADELQKTFGPGLEVAANSAAANVDRIKNAFFELKAGIGKGLLEAAAEGIPKELADKFKTDAVSLGSQVGHLLGESLAHTLKTLGSPLGVIQFGIDKVVVGIRQEFQPAIEKATGVTEQLEIAANDATRSGLGLAQAMSALNKNATEKGLEVAVNRLALFIDATQAAGGATTKQKQLIDDAMKVILRDYEALGDNAPPRVQALIEVLKQMTGATEGATEATNDLSVAAEKKINKALYESVAALTAESKGLLQHVESMDKATLSSGRFKDLLKSLLDQWDKLGSDNSSNALYQQMKKLADQLGITTKEEDKLAKAADSAAKKHDQLEKAAERAAAKQKRLEEVTASAAARLLEQADAAKKAAAALVDNLSKSLDDLIKTRDELNKKTSGGTFGEIGDLQQLSEVEDQLRQKHIALGEAQQKLAAENANALPPLKGLNDEFHALGLNLDIARVPAKQLADFLDQLGEHEAAASVRTGALSGEYKKVKDVLTEIKEKGSGAFDSLVGDSIAGATAAVTQLNAQLDATVSKLEIAQKQGSPQSPTDVNQGPQQPDKIVPVEVKQNELVGKSADELQKMLQQLPPTWAQNTTQAEQFQKIMEALNPTVHEVADASTQLSTSTQQLAPSLVEIAKQTEEARAKLEPTALGLATMADKAKEATKNTSLTADALGRITNIADDADGKITKVGDTFTNIKDSTAGAADSMVKFSDASGNAVTSLGDQSAAIAGLASRQAEFDAQLPTTAAGIDDVASSTTDATKTAEDFNKKMGDMEARLSQVEKKLKDTFGEATLGGMKDIATYLESTLLPLCEKLRDCLDATGV